MDFANHANVAYIEEMFERYQQDPEAIPNTWRFFFEGMAFAAKGDIAAPPAPGTDGRVLELIRAYRKWGHLEAAIDPLGRPRPEADQLKLEQFGLDEAVLDEHVPGAPFYDEYVTLQQLVDALRRTYCGHVGVEYMDGLSQDVEHWFQERIEPNQNQPQLSLDEKRAILTELNEAELLEKFLHLKYKGQKRFSLEGGEAFVPCLAELIETLAEEGADEVVIGMSHRGRLNVLANIMGKSYEDLFAEFEPNFQPDTVEGDGDVKYHKGFVAEYGTRAGVDVKVTLADNPSHLEAVCPVVEGLVRAHQSLRDLERKGIVPVLVHGDASFAGQGIVPETLNMSQLEGYRTGGTIHVVINNQIGFTTNPEEGRSSTYATDVARMIMAPVFHVNGDDPEAVVHVTRLAAQFRQTFQRDVVIDINCYRRHGHNETDEASFTQPVMYKIIRKMDSPRKAYVDALVQQGELEAEVARELEDDFRKKLDEALETARSGEAGKKSVEAGEHFDDFQVISQERIFGGVDTAVDANVLTVVAESGVGLPSTFKPHRKALKLMEKRLEQLQKGEKIDWGNAEILAYGSLLLDKIPVRVSGQDVKRGTFSHRHAVLFDLETAEAFVPLNHMRESQAKLNIYNSHLSEAAVLGFEWGYSLAKPKSLVIWEAQFGDFSNGAQIIIDQFIASSESKWNRSGSLVMFLPHGYEGQGPEHSSARLERFLQLCAQNNIQVANLTTPAQLFHILRRQVLRDFRKPLVIMTPKSLLRLESCVSRREDFTENGFHEIMADTVERPKAKRLLLCSGKLYYELIQQRSQSESDHVAIARIEQLYPLAEDQLRAVRASYDHLQEICWVQEEPRNMGAWSFIEPRLRELFDLPVRYIGREAGASPAVGSLNRHRLEQEAIIQKAFHQE